MRFIGAYAVYDSAKEGERHGFNLLGEPLLCLSDVAVHIEAPLQSRIGSGGAGAATMRPCGVA